jgi:hypothetical protein
MRGTARATSQSRMPTCMARVGASSTVEQETLVAPGPPARQDGTGRSDEEWQDQRVDPAGEPGRSTRPIKRCQSWGASPQVESTSTVLCQGPLPLCVARCVAQAQCAYCPRGRVKLCRSSHRGRSARVGRRHRGGRDRGLWRPGRSAGRRKGRRCRSGECSAFQHEIGGRRRHGLQAPTNSGVHRNRRPVRRTALTSARRPVIVSGSRSVRC